MSLRSILEMHTRLAYVALNILVIACGSDRDDPPTGSGLGTTGGGATFSTSRQSSSAVGGGRGGSGAGGMGACAPCGDYVMSPTVSTDDLCPDSQMRLSRLGACACGNAAGDPGACDAFCPVACGIDPNGNDNACLGCMQNECAPEWEACFADPGAM